LANTCLLSKPSFFEMSYIRTGIFVYRFEPCLPYRLHRLDPNLPELLAPRQLQPVIGASPTLSVRRAASARAASKMTAA
jgi:hypothetical protein